MRTRTITQMTTPMMIQTVMSGPMTPMILKTIGLMTPMRRTVAQVARVATVARVQVLPGRHRLATWSSLSS